MEYIESFLEEIRQLTARLDHEIINNLIGSLADIRRKQGRLFILGAGGSAAMASHAVNDFRKLCKLEAYAPTDNVSELTARINDEGWESYFPAWLRESRLGKADGILIFSVGGGDLERNISVGIINALNYAKKHGAITLGVVGRDGGATAALADICLIIPPLFPERVTPHTESFHAVICHLMVSHPLLQLNSAKWESAR